jgi:hypothetical protein
VSHVTLNVLLIVGAQGKLRMFEPLTFKHLATLPLPAPLSFDDGIHGRHPGTRVLNCYYRLQ